MKSFLNSLKILLPLMVAGNVAAQNEMPVNLPSQSVSGVAELLFGLFLVIGLIFLLSWAVKKYGRFSVSAQGKMKIIGGLSMGSREKVVLMQVGDRKILLGVAPGRVSTLHVFDEDDCSFAETPVKDNASNEQVGFAEKFNGFLKQGDLS